MIKNITNVVIIVLMKMVHYQSFTQQASHIVRFLYKCVLVLSKDHIKETQKYSDKSTSNAHLHDVFKSTSSPQTSFANHNFEIVILTSNTSTYFNCNNCCFTESTTIFFIWFCWFVTIKHAWQKQTKVVWYLVCWCYHTHTYINPKTILM